MGLYHSPRIITDGLFLYIDAANPKSYPGSGTTWYDLSGNGNNGTISNSPTYDGFSFTFTNTSSQKVSIPYRSEWRLIGSNAFSFWSNGNPDGGSKSAISYQKLDWEGYIITNNSIYYSSVSGSNDINATPAITKSNGEWCMFTWVINRASSLYEVYKNDTFVSSQSITQPDLSSDFTDGELYIGGSFDVAGRYYIGSISAVCFYTKALTATEIKQNFNALRGRYGI